MSERWPRMLMVASLPAIVAACSVGPDYKPLTPPVAGAWHAPLGSEGRSTGDTIGAAWWRTLGDPQLERLVEQAIAANTDVRVAIARVREARAVRRGAIAGFFPTVDSSASYERRQPSGSSFSPSSASGGSGRPDDYNQWTAGFDASWEVDIFGGVRRSTEQATAELGASEADLRDVLVSIVAELARNYVELRSLQRRVAIAEDNAKSQRETLEIVRWRFQAGLVGALDVDQAEYNLAQTRARVPALEIDLAAARNRIAVLTGAPAGSLDAELSPPRPVPVPPRTIAVGLPVDLVRRRADVSAAERRLAAATAAIGVATADLYPRLTLNGSLDVAATDFASIDNSIARGWSLGPSIRWNVFDAGRIRSVIAQRSAEADAALADWEGLVLKAVEEGENALTAFDREQSRRAALQDARASARRAYELARMQYENGLVDFQQVLESQRALLGFEESWAISDAAVTTDLVALYKALGGGWQAVDCSSDACREKLAAASGD